MEPSLRVLQLGAWICRCLNPCGFDLLLADQHFLLTAQDTPLILPNLDYRLVLETLDPLPEDRKCFRMINGVLVERTVKDVIPALKTNADGLTKVLDDLVKSYKLKQDELETWKVRHMHLGNAV